MPEIEPPATVRKLVVGVDGSDGSAKALDWAIAEAVRSPAVPRARDRMDVPDGIGLCLRQDAR